MSTHDPYDRSLEERREKENERKRVAHQEWRTSNAIGSHKEQARRRINNYDTRQQRTFTTEDQQVEDKQAVAWLTGSAERNTCK